MYKKDVLNNGLKVITSHMPHMESVSIGIWIGVGGRHENKKLCGISHLIEHMLFKGTSSRTAKALKEAIEGIGGSFNAFTGEELTCYLVKLPSGYMRLGLDILSDMILNPTLDPEELEKEKYVICEEIKMYIDEPRHYIFDILDHTMWPNHALGRPITGYGNTVKNLTRDELSHFKNQYYQPANISVVACGKTDRKKNAKFTRDIFPMASKKRSFPCEPVKEIHKEKAVSLFRKDTKQTHIAFGFHSVNRTHKLVYALTLLNIILGGNMSSRLFENLREKKALCYDISSSIKKYKETGAFVIHAGVDNDKLLEAAGEIINELRDIKKSPVTPGELYRAKEYYRVQFLLAMEETFARMIWLGERIMFFGKAPSVNEIFRNIEKVPAEDIKKTANIVFAKKNLNFVTIGPAGDDVKKKLRETLVL